MIDIWELIKSDEELILKLGISSSFSNFNADAKAHEEIGFRYFTKKTSLIPLLRVHNKLHGFDGLFLDPNNIIVAYESKLYANTVNSMTSSAMGTANNPVANREHELGNIKDKLSGGKGIFSKTIVTEGKKYRMKKQTATAAIKKLDELIGEIGSKTFNIPSEDIIFWLGVKKSNAKREFDKDPNQTLIDSFGYGVLFYEY